MSKEIEKWLNDKDFVLAYRFNLDIAYEVNEDLKSCVKQLQEENKYLKEKLENSLKVNLADHRYASEMEGKYLVEHNILTELEKWLKIRIKEETWAEWHDGLCECLDKLQELKEGNK